VFSLEAACIVVVMAVLNRNSVPVAASSSDCRNHATYALLYVFIHVYEHCALHAHQVSFSRQILRTKTILRALHSVRQLKLKGGDVSTHFKSANCHKASNAL
jgi:hypothetical protein